MSTPRLHSIVKMIDGISPQILLIIEDNPHKPVNRFTGVALSGAKAQYIFPADKISFVIGQAEPEAIEKIRGIVKASTANEAPANNRTANTVSHCTYMAHVADPKNKDKWLVLEKLNTGDKITIMHNGKPEEVEFMGVMTRGVKFAFTATRLKDGRSYKYMVGNVIL